MSFLQVSGITRLERGRAVVKNISFTQQQFRQLAIAGETGSGKSSLLRLIAGLIESDGGEVLFEGKKIIGPADKLIPGHPGIAYLSQYFELPNFLQVEEVLSYASRLTDEETTALYGVCRISHLLQRRTDQLSGGEKQRIAMARELLGSPRLLLLDEPYSNLDMIHKRILKEVIHDIGEKLKITCILVSHDPLDALSWADELMVLKDGQVQQQGTPWQIYRQPVNEYVAGLFGGYTILNDAQARAFSLPAEAAGGKNIFVRPELFQLSHKGTPQTKGTVKRLGYGGSFYELDIQLASGSITAKTSNGEWARGDELYVSLAPENIWYL